MNEYEVLILKQWLEAEGIRLENKCNEMLGYACKYSDCPLGGLYARDYYEAMHRLAAFRDFSRALSKLLRLYDRGV